MLDLGCGDGRLLVEACGPRFECRRGDRYELDLVLAAEARSAVAAAGLGAPHPAVVLGCIVDCAVGAWLGHDGFQWPGSGDYFHQLHHAHFDCNYGAMHAPWDYWFGTYIRGPQELKAVWAKKNGKSGNKEEENPKPPINFR